MTPKLKPPGSKRLKLRCVVPLSNFALKFKLRRYMTDAAAHLDAAAAEHADKDAALADLRRWGTRVTRYPISILSSPISIQSSPISILSSSISILSSSITILSS